MPAPRGPTDETREQDTRRAERHELLEKVAHELRTPLNAILGFTKLLHTGKAGPLSATQAEYVGDVLQSSKHLLKLMNDVLELARLELGGVTIAAETVDPSSLVREVCDTLGGLAVEKQQRLRIEPSAELGEVQSDSRLLKQLVMHLLSNALRFTPEQGTIALRVRPDGAEHFRIEIEDSGPGIPADDLGCLFVPFQKLDGRKRDLGNGLGLPLAKRLAEALGGSLAAESSVGRGSVFCVRLPRWRTSASQRRPARPRGSAGSP